MPEKLLIPPHIRFECTFCGHCCHSWPVPLTAGDVERIKAISAIEAISAKVGESPPIALLSERERKESGLVGYTSALLKDKGGKCSFLNDENLCLLHGTEAKPSMCQLFPYSFLHCPEGVLVGLSFASSGVLANSGALLSEQENTLAKTLGLFEELNPQLKSSTLASWHLLEISAGLPLSYEQYLPLQEIIAGEIEPLLENGRQLIETSFPGLPEVFVRLAQLFFNLRIMSKNYGGAAAKESAESSQETKFRAEREMDIYLLATYFSTFISQEESGQMTLASRLVERLSSVLKERPSLERLLQEDELISAALAPLQLSAEEKASGEMGRVHELFARFAYVRIFSRLYFGPGFSGLSMTAGLGHLYLLLTLAWLKFKTDLAFCDAGQKSSPGFLIRAATEAVRLVDRQWTSLRYPDANSKNMLEVAFLDEKRPLRLLPLLQ